MEQKTVVDFDIDRYMRNSKKVDLSHLDWDEIPNHELSDGDVMCMHYMMDIESHTVIYLRDLLATHPDALANYIGAHTTAVAGGLAIGGAALAMVSGVTAELEAG